MALQLLQHGRVRGASNEEVAVSAALGAGEQPDGSKVDGLVVMNHSRVESLQRLEEEKADMGFIRPYSYERIFRELRYEDVESLHEPEFGDMPER